MLENDLKQFISDYNKIREIWYNAEPIEPGVERSKLHKASQLAMYIQNHPYYLRSALSKKNTTWICKLICTLDVNICEDFINEVEKGMTVYDWHIFAVKQYDWYKKWGTVAIEQTLGTIDPSMSVTPNMSKTAESSKKTQQEAIKQLKDQARSEAVHKLKALLTDEERNLLEGKCFLQSSDLKLVCKRGQVMPFVGPDWHPVFRGVQRNALDAFDLPTAREIIAYAKSE